MLQNYYLKNAKQVWNDIGQAPRKSPEVLIATQMERVVNAVLEKMSVTKKADSRIKCGLIGIGPFARDLAAILYQSNMDPICAWEPISKERLLVWDTDRESLPVVSKLDKYVPFYSATLSPSRKQDFYDKHHAELLLGNAVFHPSAQRCPDVFAQPGTVIGPLTWIGANVQIGKLVTVHVGASVGTDATVEDFCEIEQGAIIHGGVRLGVGVKVGARAIIFPGVRIAAGVEVQAGALIRTSIIGRGKK